MICPIDKLISTIYSIFNMNSSYIIIPKIHKREIFKKNRNTKNIMFCIYADMIDFVVNKQVTFNFKLLTFNSHGYTTNNTFNISPNPMIYRKFFANFTMTTTYIPSFDTNTNSKQIIFYTIFDCDGNCLCSYHYSRLYNTNLLNKKNVMNKTMNKLKYNLTDSMSSNITNYVNSNLTILINLIVVMTFFVSIYRRNSISKT